MFKRAIILAGGFGTRLKPYTITIPKPLVPIGERPILEIIIRQLAKYNFKEITLAVNHQADIIKAYFQDGRKWGVHINYSLENKPLGTMGPLKLISDLPNNFLVMNGDVLTDLDYGRFYEKHCTNENLFSISSYMRKEKIDFGVLKTNQNQLTQIQEKPEYTFEVSMGVYAINSSIIEFIPDNLNFGFDDLINKLLRNNLKVDVIEHIGYWLDIGRPDDYEKSINDIADLK